MAKMTVTLDNRGNPDMGQDPRRPVFGAAGKAVVEVKSYAEAAAACRQYITLNGLGAGNWTGGQVRVGRKVVASVSYNGRVWLPDGTEAK